MADATGISTVLLDLDETICDHPRPAADRLADAFAAAGVDQFFTVTDVRRWLPKVTAETALELRRRCFSGIADELGMTSDPAYAVARAYEDPIPTDVQFLPGAEAVLDSLGDRYDLGLVTNGGRETQRRKLDALGIADAFDATVFREPGGPVKPDTEPFDRALSALGTSPSEAVHVGNSLRADVVGAQAAGVDAVWLSNAAETDDVLPEYTIDSMADLETPPWV